MFNVALPPQLAAEGGRSWPLPLRLRRRGRHMLSGCVRLGTFALALGWAAAAPASALCVRGVEAWDTLRIRAGPSPQAREVGAIPPRTCGVSIAGPCRGAWCPVVWRGRQGWSNAAYLSQGGVGDGLWLPPPVDARQVREPQRPSPADRRAGPPRVAATPPPRPVEAVQAPARNASPPLPPPAPRPVERALPAAPPAGEASPGPATSPPASAKTAVVVAPAPPAATQPATGAAEAGAQMCVHNVAAGDTLMVRAGPGPDQSLRYGYPAGACGIMLTGGCKDGWCPVDYRGYRGWAEQKFLK